MSIVSEELRVFLEQRLSSIEQIEITLLLRRERERSFSAPEVAAELGMPPESAAMRLFLLASGGLLLFEASGVPRYRYAGADAATDALLADLQTAYSENPGAVRALVGAPPDPIRSFADAFKFKK